MPHRVAASALIVDLRGFTERLQHYLSGRSSVDLPAVISRFSMEVVEVCREVLNGAPTSTLHLNSTGDGALALFLAADGEAPSHHALRAYAASLRLLAEMPTILSELGIQGAHPHDYQFGVGAESGHVVFAGFHADSSGEPGLDTWLGHCINVSARLEALNKTFNRTCVLVGEELACEVAAALLDVDYRLLLKQASMGEQSARTAARQRMHEANQALLLDYVGRVNFRGCMEPIRSFRISPSLLEEAGPRVLQACRGHLEGTSEALLEIPALRR